MTLEALPDFVVYDTISATPLQQNAPTNYQAFLANNNGSIAFDGEGGSGRGVMGDEAIPTKRRRRRRPRRCKNKEEAESQRMTHIAVERNRRRLMNEHLAVLRSLMPPSYIQRGDQASIVGGAIDFVKELEQLLQSLEVQKRTTLQLLQKKPSTGSSSSGSSSYKSDEQKNYPPSPPFSHFFAYPQYIWCHSSNSPEYPPSMPDSQSAVGDIEVNLIETHANLRILTLRRPHQLLKMCTSLQTLRLSILHLNVTTFDSIVLYSISAKVEEGCNLSTVEDIAAAVHHILALFQAELDSCSNV